MINVTKNSSLGAVLDLSILEEIALGRVVVNFSAFIKKINYFQSYPTFKLRFYLSFDDSFKESNLK
jgi:hypothetical protein